MAGLCAMGWAARAVSVAPGVSGTSASARQGGSAGEGSEWGGCSWPCGSRRGAAGAGEALGAAGGGGSGCSGWGEATFMEGLNGKMV